MSAPIVTTAPSLEIVSMTMRFGAFVALDTASMKVEPGAFHALLGGDEPTVATCRLRLSDVLAAHAGAERRANADRDEHAGAVVLGLGLQHLDVELPPAGPSCASSTSTRP